LENAKELIDKFERRIEAEVRRQKGIEKKWKVKLNLNIEELRRSELLGKYIAKILFEWNNRKFKNKYLKKLERSWIR